MALDYPNHALLQLQGTVGSTTSPTEVWSTSCRFRTQGGLGGGVDLTYETQNQWLGEHIDDITDWFTDVDTDISSNFSLTQVKFNAINATGHYVHDNTSLLNIANVQGGVTPTSPLPLQVARVASLGTGNARGHAARGRMYLPGPASQLNSNYVWNLGVAQAVAARTAQLLSALSNQGGIPDTLLIFPAVVSGLGGGTFHSITEVSVDTIPDTQRRRANALTGARAFSPV